MENGDNGGKRTIAAIAIEQRVVAFAEQLGRIAGTVQAKAEGWMDRDALSRQIESVRDGAADLLEQLAGRTAKVSKTAGGAAPNARPRAERKGRSGGVVDAPGKKHRKPPPADSRAAAAGAKSSAMRAGKSSMKTVKLRGRG